VASNVYGAIALTGGTDGAVDSIKDEVIADGDMCIAIVGGATDACYIYTFDDSSATAESSPDVIKPDNAGGNGRWILCTQVVNNLTVQGNATVAGTLGVTGVLTASGGLTMSSDLTLADGKDIVLDNAPASDHLTSGTVSSFTAGENVAFGDFCYFKSDGKMWKSDADATTTMPICAMATETILADAAGEFLMFGFARDDTWAWTVGGILYASTTAGALTQTVPSGTGDQVQTVGIATHADRIWFFPNFQLVEIS
jgi:hypothetical protein